MLELIDNTQIIGATYTPKHYQLFEKTGNKNLFEEVIDMMMLETFSEEFKQKVMSMPLKEKRMAILSLLDKDRNLFLRIKSLINGGIGKFEHIKDVIKMLREYVKVGEVEKKKYGEVMTPLELVKEMLNTLPEDVWSNPNLKWLDPANGTGPYPLMVIYKLMNGLKEWEPNEEKRYKHIVENMIYVCELQPKNMFLYMCAVDPWDMYHLNIYTGSFLTDGFDKHMKEVWNVDKFDIVMGNPPYQEMDGGSKASAKPIYNLFVLKSTKLSNKILFITPSRWFIGGKGLDLYRKFMMESNKIKSIKHYNDATQIFGNNVDITGGVSYFLFDNMYNGNCNLNNNIVNLNEYDVIVDPSYISIINKFKNYNSISTICMGRGDNTFGIQTNDRRISEYLPGDINCFVSQSKGFEKWIDGSKIKNHQHIDKYKVITAESNGSYPRFGNKFIAHPYMVCSGSYIWFVMRSKEEAESLISYMECKLVNYLLSIRKISQHIKPSTLKWIPMVPFDRKWTDEQLFEYFNLTEEERNLILNYDKK